MSSKSELPSYDERVIQRLQSKIEVTEVIVDELGDQEYLIETRCCHPSPDGDSSAES